MTGPFAAHTGGHVAARPSFFRRGLRLPWRKPAAVPACPPAGAATPAGGTAVLGDRMLSEVRAELGERPGGVLTDAQQVAHAGVMHKQSARYLPPQPRRPVNGRSLGTMPRIATPDHPPWVTAAMPVLPTGREMREAYFTPAGGEIVYSRADHDELDREFADRPSLEVLGDVLEGLRKL
jgi:hypothetical protein